MLNDQDSDNMMNNRQYCGCYLHIFKSRIPVRMSVGIPIGFYGKLAQFLIGIPLKNPIEIPIGILFF